jgi:hypothetical protein
MYGMLKSLNVRVKTNNSEKKSKLPNEAELDYDGRTVHTFQGSPAPIHVIVVVEESFSPGLIYSALSRGTSVE